MTDMDDILSGHQFPPTLPARVLADPSVVRWGDIGKGELHHDVQMQKLEDSLGLADYDHPGLYDDIEANGVKEPVRVHTPPGWSPHRRLFLSDGMHRVATAVDIDPDMEVPVYWAGDAPDHWLPGVYGRKPKG